VDALTQEDSTKMKAQLALRNKIYEFEKKNEKVINETVKEMETGINEIKKDGFQKLHDGDVKVSELNEELKAMKENEKKKVMYELELFEWGQQCRKKQDEITQTKYNS